MFRPVKMLSGVFVFGGIATSDVAADQAHPQVDPLVTRLQTFLAAICAWLDFLNFFDVRTCFRCHCVLLGSEFPFTTLGDSSAPPGQLDPNSGIFLIWNPYGSIHSRNRLGP